MWRSLVALSRLVTRASLWGPPTGLSVEHCELDKKCVGHASGCGQRAFGAPAEQLLPWSETSWQGLFRLEHLAWAPHLLFPTAKVCAVEPVRFGWKFPLQGSRAWLGFSQRDRHPVHQNVGYGIWGCSIAPTRVSAEVRVKVTAFVTDTISIRAGCCL